MRELPATPASALTRATEQLQGLDLRDGRQPEPPEGPLNGAAAELLLLAELAGQRLSTLGRVDRWRVWRAVRRGVAVGDSRLATAAMAVAMYQARDAVTTLTVRRPWTLFVGPVLIGMTGVVAVFDVGNHLRQAIGVVVLISVAFSIRHVVQMLTGSPRRAARADRAVGLNRALPPVAFSPGENGSAPDDRPTTLEQPCPEKPDAS